MLTAIVALALYAITLNGVFIYDDVAIIETDRRIANPALWGEYWTDSYNFGVDNLYRPLVSMSYAIQHYLHGPRPMPFHLVNWLLHALVSALVARFAMKLAERCDIDARMSRRIGLIAGVLFAAHPIHVEAVANVVGRAELMCAAGVLGAMLIFLEPLTRGRIAGLFACFVLALLSKEQGMLVPLLLGLLWAAERWVLPARLAAGVVRTESATITHTRESTPPAETLSYESRFTPRATPLGPILFLLLAGTLAGYVSYRESILKFWWDKNFLDTWIQPLSAPDVTLTDRLLVPITIAGRYLQLLVAPVALRLDYGGVIVPGRFDARDPYFYAGLFAIVLWVALFVIAIRQRDRFSLIALLAFGCLYGLIGNIATMIGVNMAERLMYLPSAFFLLIVARWLTRLPSRVSGGLVAIIVVMCCVRSVTYAVRWNDRLGFYTYAAGVEPRSLKAVQLAMQEYLDRGEFASAKVWGERALEISPNSDDAMLRLAMVHIELGTYDVAEQLIDQAQHLNPAGNASVYRETLEQRRKRAD